MFRYFFTILTVALFTAISALAMASESTWPAGDWRGTLNAGGQELGIVYHLQVDDDQASGTMDVPAQGAMGLPLPAVETEGDRLTIKMPLPGQARFEGSRAGDAIKGTFSQAGQSFPLTLERAVSAAPPKRPQEPSEPLPYRSEAVSFEGAGEIRLAGTLTRPEGSGPFPGVVLVAGAGPHDRDGTFMNHRPLLVLADYLTRAGFSVLRFDERGIGESAGEFASASGEALAGDIAAAIETLRQQEDSDPARIGLLAHSEGGRTAALAIAAHESIDFLVMLGAPARPGIEALRAQAERSANPIAGLQAAMAEAALEIKPGESTDRPLREAASEFMETLPDEQRAALSGQAQTIVDQLVQGLSQPQARFSLAFDPRPALEDADIPVLALYGGKDRQIDAAGAEQAWRAALESDATIETLPNLNHFFQEADTGAPSEYASIEQTIAPAALARIVDWLISLTGGAQ
ncbi:MAG: alpha/beta hydrolase family protein [Wenzhouxiangellaceae bacterium]